MKKMRILAVLAALLIVVGTSAFRSVKPPTLVPYGFEEGFSAITPNQTVFISGEGNVTFTFYEDVVLLDEVENESCISEQGSRCKIQLPPTTFTSEPQNVIFDVSGDRATVKVRQSMVSTYADITVDNKLLILP